MKINIKKSKLRFFFYILTAVVMGTIFYLSGQNAADSSDTSGTFITFLLNLFNMEPTAEKVASLQGIIRTGAHFCAFGTLGFMFLCSYLFSGKNRRIFLFPFICTFIYSVTDEIHQLFPTEELFSFLIFLSTTWEAPCLFLSERQFLRFSQKSA